MPALAPHIPAAQTTTSEKSSSDYKIESVSFSVTDLRTIILLLKSPETDTLPSVLEWIAKYAGKCKSNL